MGPPAPGSHQHGSIWAFKPHTNPAPTGQLSTANSALPNRLLLQAHDQLRVLEQLDKRCRALDERVRQLQQQQQQHQCHAQQQQPGVQGRACTAELKALQ